MCLNLNVSILAKVLYSDLVSSQEMMNIRREAATNI